MADKTSLAESSQALFCAIADFLGERKSNQALDLSKYSTYLKFKKNFSKSIISTAFKRITTPGVSLKDIDEYLSNDDGWYKSSVLIAKKLIKDITFIDPDYKIKQEGFQEIYYFRGDNEVMIPIEELFKIANNSPATAVKFGNVNKWSPADIYLATIKAKKDIAKELSEVRPTKSYTFPKLNILTSNLIDSGDLLPLSLKKTTIDVKLEKVNFNKKDELKKMKDASMSSKGVSDWKPYKRVKFGEKTETRDLKIHLNNGGMIKIRHDPTPKFVAEFVVSGGEARGGSIGSIAQFCAMFNFVDKTTSQKILREFRDGETKYKVALAKIESLRKTDKNKYDFERGTLSGINVVNRIMPILKPWFKRTSPQGKRQVDDFIKILYSYVTSRSPLSGKFVIAKG